MDKSTFAEIRRKINSFLDHDMSPEDENQFLSQLKKDPEIENEYLKERLIRTKIRENIRRPHVGPELIDKIKNRIPR